MRLTELADLLQAKLVFPPNTKTHADLDIQKIAPIHEAQPGDLTFVANADYNKFIATTKASAIILGKESEESKVPQLIHANPYWAYAKVAQAFYKPDTGPTGVSEQAFIAADAELGERLTIYPFAFVGAGAVIGNDVCIYPGAYIGAGATIGDHSVIHANTYLASGISIGARVIIHAGSVIGADGFGFAPGENEIVKIPQTGTVVIEDDVEIGALCSIDRAAMGETRIRRSTKIDSKVHIAHNVEIGECCMLAALTGIAGSTKLGKRVMMGGHSGVSGHLQVADDVKIGAMSGVVRSTKAGETYMGFPGAPAKEWRRQLVHSKRLPQTEKELQRLAKKVEELERKLADLA